MKKKLEIKYKGKRHFVAYGDLIVGNVYVDNYRMITFNTKYFDESPVLKKAYEECEKIMQNAMKEEYKEKMGNEIYKH